MDEIFEEIKRTNCVSLKVKEQFFAGKDYVYIRKWLEEHNLDKHMSIEIRSAGIIIVIESNGSKKVLLQIRGTERKRIGIFGGGIEKDETPTDTAKRELKEELGLDIKSEQLMKLGVNDHELVYESGDKAHYLAETYLLKLNEFPYIKLDFESNGIICLSKETIQDYINVSDENSLQIYPYWLDFIFKALEV